MPSFVSTSNDSAHNMSDLCSDFESIRVSALKKACRLSDSINTVTLGPDTVEQSSPENNENQKNTCNVEITKKISPQITSKERPSRSGLTFSVKKILLENEIQRKEEVRKAIDKRKQEMEKVQKALQEEIALMREIMETTRQRKEAAQLARLEAEEERLEQQNEIRRRHEQQLHAQRLLERKERFEREAEEHRMFKEREQMLEKIRNNFRERYKDIGALSKVCKDKNSVAQVLAPFTNKLKEFNQHMELLNEKARKGELSSTDLMNAENIGRQSDEVFNLCKSEINRLDSLYDQEIAKREQEVKQAEALAQAEAVKMQMMALQSQTSQFLQGNSGVEIEKSPETPPNEVTPTNINEGGATTTDSSSVETVIEESEAHPNHEFRQIYMLSRLLIDKLTGTAEFKEFLKSPATKKFRFQCQKAINTPVNTINAAAGGHHMLEKYNQVCLVLDGHSSPNIYQHPQGPIFCKNLLAKNIVNQGETLVSRKSEMVFGVATMALALMCDYPDFGELLLSHFYTTCPYLAPIFLPRFQDQSDEEYFTSLGYKCTDGILEMKDHFLDRMSGVMRLYAAIMVSHRRRGVTVPHPFGLQNAWRWLAAMMNFVPGPEFSDVCLVLIRDMLVVTGNSLWKAYPRQFPKLLMVLLNQYCPRIDGQGETGGPMGRLKEFVHDCLTKKTVPPPDGELPRDFW